MLAVSLVLAFLIPSGEACAPSADGPLSGAAAVVRAAGLPSDAQADAFMAGVAARESAFMRPGIAFDGATGMTFDGHALDFTTGELAGEPRRFSAASKESLHIALLVKALEGDPTARTMLGPDATATAWSQLEKKIATYERFDREYPAYGGFLPWYLVEDAASRGTALASLVAERQGRIRPTDDWMDRVPGLDNGQLAWSLYLAANTLGKLGRPDLAARYRAHVDEMARNVVPMFYDPAEKKLRAEAKIEGPLGAPPARNTYSNNVAGYFLDDAYEGLLLGHFADLFGDWRAHPEGQDAIWSTPRRIRATYTTRDGRRITVVRGHWFSAHEEWAFLVLPFRDLPVADALFRNAQKVRADYSNEQRLPGLLASVTGPIAAPGEAPYVSALGIGARGITRLPTVAPTTIAPYATFPLALADRPAFAAWLANSLRAPHMSGPYGMADSFDVAHDAWAPVVTWDGKVLPMVAWMGGISGDIRTLLQRDGLYDKFLARTAADYRDFDATRIEGTDLPIAGPVVGPR